MKIKDIIIESDAYISGVFVRDDGTELRFMLMYGEYDFDQENTDSDLTSEERHAICKWVISNVGREISTALYVINSRFTRRTFEMEV